MSSVAWWLGPYPVVKPGRPPTTLTLSPGSAMSRHKKSYARRVANTEYVDANGTNPTSARPAAAPSRACSAMPIWKKRCGWASRNMCMSVYLARSADNPTISGRSSPSRASACPNGALVVGWPGSANEAIIAEVVSFLRGAVAVIGAVPPRAGHGRSATRVPQHA